MCVPGFCPGIIQIKPGSHGSSSSTRTAGSDSGTARGPVLLSARQSSPAARCTSSHLSDRISFLRQPVSNRSLIAATAWTDTPPSAMAPVEHRTETAELRVGQEPLARARRKLAHPPAGVRAVRDHPPGRRHPVHAREHRHRPVRRVGDPAQPGIETRPPSRAPPPAAEACRTRAGCACRPASGCRPPSTPLQRTATCSSM